ncbi:hypothetical protein DOTSEDRAFT_52834 [Dothistroma septosporum NZE10]|uniref:Uncharacterized protein n=1 Tax=Dothistroma septosporum (strain NZE10 / CBS 128990) TaxID=675120 RepID=N1PTB2_DOTSN|nr:hypothetical protein DOTSEDRAFT_52834 [Dothistroma septosporum NZE10]
MPTLDHLNQQRIKAAVCCNQRASRARSRHGRTVTDFLRQQLNVDSAATSDSCTRFLTDGASARDYPSSSATARQSGRAGPAAIVEVDGKALLTSEGDIAGARVEAAKGGSYLDEASEQWSVYDAKTDEPVVADDRRAARPLGLSQDIGASQCPGDRDSLPLAALGRE